MQLLIEYLGFLRERRPKRSLGETSVLTVSLCLTPGAYRVALASQLTN